MKHSCEPWTAEVFDSGVTVIQSPENCCVALTPLTADDQNKIDAARICACVNTLAGIPSEKLQRAGDLIANETRIACEALQQRDELLAALKGFVHLVDVDVIRSRDSDRNHLLTVFSAANQAIANAEGRP